MQNLNIDYYIETYRIKAHFDKFILLNHKDYPLLWDKYATNYNIKNNTILFIDDLIFDYEARVINTNLSIHDSITCFKQVLSTLYEIEKKINRRFHPSIYNSFTKEIRIKYKVLKAEHKQKIKKQNCISWIKNPEVLTSLQFT